MCTTAHSGGIQLPMMWVQCIYTKHQPASHSVTFQTTQVKVAMLFTGKESTLNMTNCTVSQNNHQMNYHVVQSTGVLGTMYVPMGKHLLLKNVVFDSNQFWDLSLSSTSAEIQNCSFFTITDLVIATGSYDTDLVIRNTSFIDKGGNNIVRGGQILSLQNRNTLIQWSEFESNSTRCIIGINAIAETDLRLYGNIFTKISKASCVFYIDTPSSKSVPVTLYLFGTFYQLNHTTRLPVNQMLSDSTWMQLTQTLNKINLTKQYSQFASGVVHYFFLFFC